MKMGARVLAKFTFAYFIRNMECFNAAQIFAGVNKLAFPPVLAGEKLLKISC